MCVCVSAPELLLVVVVVELCSSDSFSAQRFKVMEDVFLTMMMMMIVIVMMMVELEVEVEVQAWSPLLTSSALEHKQIFP